MSTYKQNGQYNLKVAELILPNEDRIDLRNVFLDISLYESIFNQTMSGNISLIDSTNELNREFLGNGETIHLDFETAGSKNNIVFYGTVYKCSPPTRVSEHTSGLILYFVSTELINSSRMTVEDAFNDQTSNITKTLFDRIKNRKNLEVTETKSIQKFVPAGHNTLEMISDLASRSISKNNEYGYLFYEDSKRFHFTPIQKLYQQESLSSYFYKNSGVFNDVTKKEEESFNSIQDYEIVSMPDLIEQIDDGTLGSKSVNLNLIEKSIVEYTYDNVSQFDRDKSLGKVPNLVANINKKYNDVTEFRSWFVNEPFHKSRFFNIKELLNAQRFGAKISVFGDTSLVAGGIINCTLPVWGTNALNGVPDPFSGRCLIVGIKHTLQRTKYVQTLKLSKDAFEVGK